MPFGLSSAPRTFTKLLDVVAAHLRAKFICLLCYLNDILVMSSSLPQADLDLQLMIQTLQDHGFTVNWEKSHLTPSISLESILNQDLLRHPFQGASVQHPFHSETGQVPLVGSLLLLS